MSVKKTPITLLLTVLLILTGCAGSLTRLEPASRKAQAEELAQSAGFSRVVWSSTPHPLWSYTRLTSAASSEVIYVYIEGDGVLQINQYGQSYLSNDPTPSPQLPLMLAAWHAQFAPQDSVVYMARPCQFTHYTREDKCIQMDWLKGRYGPKVVESFSTALDGLRAKVQRDVKFHLVGYSGGGTIAMLLANTREDIAQVTTLAANLDHETFFRLHQETYPPEPFDLIARPEKVAGTPQLHVVGGSDPIVPESIVQAYKSKLSAKGVLRGVEVERIEGQNHHNVPGWQKVWQQVLPQLRSTVIPAR
jgi:alpha/beta superfamily hydrolase